MSVIHAPEKPELDAAHYTILGGIGLGILIIIAKLWYLQAVETTDLSLDAERSLRTSVSTLAPRGLIFDRNDKLVAGVSPESVVTAVPSIVHKQAWVLDKLATMLNVPKAQLEDKLKDGDWKPYLPTPIFIGVPIEVASKIAESQGDLPGIDISTQPMRSYPDSLSLAHILGYTYIPFKEDLDRISTLLQGTDRVASSYVGKQGLEKQYEIDLMGDPGKEEMEVDSRRRPVKVVGRTPGIPGKRLYLTLDADLQKYAQEVLEVYRNKSEHAGAALVAMDMQGGILAMASAPNFDANKFKEGISQADYQALMDKSAGSPLVNRATLGAYSPGSTFKIVTTLAAVKAGIFDPNRTTNCRGYYDLGSSKPRCLGQHGFISFHEALTKSCNTYFMDLGIRAGIDNIREAAKDLGLGLKTGIDLPSERSGSFPTLAFLHARLHVPEGETPRWYKGDTANTSIGQGYVNTTPLQMALIAQTVANRGVQYKPHFLKATGVGEDIVPFVPESKDIMVGNPIWDELVSALRDVVRRGTARKAQIQGVDWAGKTGSTEFRRSASTHSWFIGFAPADNPKIAIACVLEKAGHGGDAAAPAASAVVRRYLNSLSKAASASNTLRQSATNTSSAPGTAE